MALGELVFSYVDKAGRYHFIRQFGNYVSDTADYRDALVDAVDEVTGELLKRVPISELRPFCDSTSITIAAPKSDRRPVSRIAAV